MFISSKLWSSFHGKDDVLKACRESIRNLNVEYLDLYLVHWPITIKSGHNDPHCSDDVKLGYSAERIAECWRAMEDLVDRGLVKAIGISNFSITKIERLLKTARIIPAVNQVWLVMIMTSVFHWAQLMIPAKIGIRDIYKWEGEVEEGAQGQIMCMVRSCYTTERGWLFIYYIEFKNYASFKNDSEKKFLWDD